MALRIQASVNYPLVRKQLDIVCRCACSRCVCRRWRRALPMAGVDFGARRAEFCEVDKGRIVSGMYLSEWGVGVSSDGAQ